MKHQNWTETQKKNVLNSIHIIYIRKAMLANNEKLNIQKHAKHIKSSKWQHSWPTLVRFPNPLFQKQVSWGTWLDQHQTECIKNKRSLTLSFVHCINLCQCWLLVGWRKTNKLCFEFCNPCMVHNTPNPYITKPQKPPKIIIVLFWYHGIKNCQTINNLNVFFSKLNSSLSFFSVVDEWSFDNFFR